jgi:hypothetical protein
MFVFIFELELVLMLVEGGGWEGGSAPPKGSRW